MLPGLGECSLLVFLIFWALRNMTQFETDTAYFSEEMNEISKLTIVPKTVAFFSPNRCLRERRWPPLMLRFLMLNFATGPASGDASSPSRCLRVRCPPSRAAQHPPLPRQPLPASPPPLQLVGVGGGVRLPTPRGSTRQGLRRFFHHLAGIYMWRNSRLDKLPKYNCVYLSRQNATQRNRTLVPLKSVNWSVCQSVCWMIKETPPPES